MHAYCSDINTPATSDNRSLSGINLRLRAAGKESQELNGVERITLKIQSFTSYLASQAHQSAKVI